MLRKLKEKKLKKTHTHTTQNTTPRKSKEKEYNKIIRKKREAILPRKP